MKRLSFVALALMGCSTDTFVAPDSGISDASSDAPSSSDGNCGVANACPAGNICLNFDQSSYSPFIDVSKGGGQVDFSSDQYVTCPKSLAATIGQATATTTPIGEIATTLLTGSNLATAKGHLEADVFLPATTSGAATYLALDANADPNSVVALAVNGNGDWVLWVQASNNFKPIAPRVGAWNHIALDVMFSSSGGTGHAKLSYTDHNDVPTSVDIFAATTTASTVSNVIGAVGIQATSTSTASVTAYYDDVAFGIQ